MKKSDLSKEYLLSWVDDIDFQYGDIISKNCQEAIDKLGPDDKMHTGEILSKAFNDNPDILSRIIESSNSSSNLRLDIVIQI
jgi:hypothetical protein